jgi:hypothetical protein
MIAGGQSSFDILRALFLLAMLSGGCATHVTPPSFVRDPVTVFVTDYGKHSSIVLPDPDGGYVEYAYGDYDWFALGDVNLFSGIRAIFASPKATLGRRYFPARDGPLAPADLRCEKLSEFAASQARVEALRMNLESIFNRSREKPIHSDFSMLEHVPDPQQYWLFHNCNHATAEWLRSLGCRVDGPAILSNFRLTQPDK